MAESHPTPPPSPGRKAPIISQYLLRTDACITRLNRILSTPSGTDTLLMTLNYTLQTLLITSPTLSPRLRALTNLISDIRVFARLWGLLGIYAWARSTITSPPADTVLRVIAAAQIAVNVGFQALENAAYLASHGVIGGLGRRRQAKAWMWSSRFWAAHVFLDLGRLWRVRMLKQRERKGEKGNEEEASEEEWWRAVAVNLAYAPLTLHWSVEGGVVSDATVGALGSVAGLIGLREAWRRAA